ALTPDASVREYFRVPWQGCTAIAAVYPEPFDSDAQSFLDITKLFAEANLPIPQILDVDGANGIILQEDLGDRQLRTVLESSSEDESEKHVNYAISLIADIQAATSLAYKQDSIASRLAFDEAKLGWELNFFLEHYFGSLRKEELKASEKAELQNECQTIAAELAARPRVLCHRDFHTSNLMVDGVGQLRIVDYQDARMGPTSYDLVTLLLDRRLEPPSSAELHEKKLLFFEERWQRGLPIIDAEEFASEFRLMTVQRCLKAVGTFSCQTGVYGRGAVYAQFIDPALLIVLQAAEWLDRFPTLCAAIRARLNDR
nr:phosphotransferase [Pyrinomonadaceae bacterium]